MSHQEDTRLVDYLYGELSEKDAEEYRRALESDPEAKADLASYASILGTLRSVEDEEPSPHLDSLILAGARQAAEETAIAERERGLMGWLRKIVHSPMRVALAGGVAVLAAVLLVPATMKMQSADRSAPMYRSAPAAESIAAAPPAQTAQTTPAKTEAKELVANDQEVPLEEAQAQAHEPARAARRALAKEAKREEAKADADDAKVIAEKSPPRQAAPKPEPEPVLQQPAATGAIGGAGVAAGEAPAKKGADALADEDLGGRAESKKPAPPPVARSAATAPESPKEAPKDTASETVSRGAIPATTEPTRDATSVEPSRAAELADSMIRASNNEVQRGDPQGARNTLITALNRVRDTPSYGEVALALARLDLSQRRTADAIRWAKAAARTPRFARRLEALALVEQIARQTGDEADLGWVDAERKRAK